MSLEKIDIEFDKIPVEQIVNSLNDFKKAIYSVNYVNKLIRQQKK